MYWHQSCPTLLVPEVLVNRKWDRANITYVFDTLWSPDDEKSLVFVTYKCSFFVVITNDVFHTINTTPSTRESMPFLSDK